jgi:pimeloyl-ACP methyl ester carboxylesterase
VASTNTDVAYIVMMAGTGVTGKEILEEQMIAMARAEGVGEEALKAQSVAQKKLLAAAVGNDPAALDVAMRELVAFQAAGSALSKEDLEKAVAQAKTQFESGWMKAFLTLDPRGYLRKTTCPVLVLNGSKDSQVLPGQNVPEITKALIEGGNGDFQVRVFPGLNHLFQTCKTGGMSEYAVIDETIAPVALETIGTWVKAQGVAR